MSRTIMFASIAVGIAAATAGVGAVLWKPAETSSLVAQAQDVPAAVAGDSQERAAAPTAATTPRDAGQKAPIAMRRSERPISRISDVFHEIDPVRYDQAIARSKLAPDDVKVLKSLLPNGKIKLAELTLSGQGQTISISGVDLKQTVKLEPKPQTLTIPYIPGVPVTFRRDKGDDVPGVIRIHANRTTMISMQALIPGAEVNMSTPKQTASAQ